MSLSALSKSSLVSAFSHVAILLLLLSYGKTLAQTRYHHFKLDSQWKWSYGDSSIWHKPNFNDSKWPTRKADGYWRDIKGKLLTIRQWVVIPANLRTKGYDSVIFDLGYIDDVDVTYLNGREIGRKGTYPPCESAWSKRRRYKVAVTDTILKWGKPNLLSIKIWNQGNAGGIWGMEPMMYIPQPAIKLKVNWPTSTKSLGIAKPGQQQFRLSIENQNNQKVTGQAVIIIYPKSDHGKSSTIIQDIELEANTSNQLKINTLITKSDYYQASLKLVTSHGVWADSSLVLIPELPEEKLQPTRLSTQDSIQLFVSDSLVKPDQKIIWFGPDSWLPIAELESDSCGWRSIIANELRLRMALANKLPNTDLQSHLTPLLGIKLKSGWLSADDKLKSSSGIGIAEYWQQYDFEHNAILAQATLETKTTVGLKLAQNMVDEWLSYWGPEGNQLNPNVVLTGRTSELALLLLPTMALYNQTRDNKYLQFGRFIIRQIDGSNGNKLLSQLLAKEPIEPFLANDPVKLLLMLRGLNLAAQYADNPVWQQAVDYAYEDLSRHFIFDANKKVRRSFISLETMIEWHYLSVDLVNNPKSLMHLETGQITILPQTLVKLLLNELTQRLGIEAEKQLASILYQKIYMNEKSVPLGLHWSKID